eukprot:TRINITY_DN6119_c0_g1_i4.p1 TRINITY_DN6119_c0_g1~~TRINITY_DN6119_c0_g1_i4.p1  ORF type:complete len:236 (+),score=42.83 TRINITY_DN6119_c0_g1_i4:677-1384(+)
MTKQNTKRVRLNEVADARKENNVATLRLNIPKRREETSKNAARKDDGVSSAPTKGANENSTAERHKGLSAYYYADHHYRVDTSGKLAHYYELQKMYNARRYFVPQSASTRNAEPMTEGRSSLKLAACTEPDPDPPKPADDNNEEVKPKKEIIDNNPKTRKDHPKYKNIAPKPASRSMYEPMRFPQKYIRKWETAHRKKWHDLSIEDREKANNQIGKMMEYEEALDGGKKLQDKEK